MSAPKNKYEWQKRFRKVRMTEVQRALLGELGDRFNDRLEGDLRGSCIISAGRLAKEIGVNQRTVEDYLALFRAAGWIKMKVSGGRIPSRIWWQAPEVIVALGSSKRRESRNHTAAFNSGACAPEQDESPVPVQNPISGGVRSGAEKPHNIEINDENFPVTLEDTLVRGTPNGSPLYAEYSLKGVGESSFVDSDEMSVPNAALRAAGTSLRDDNPEISAPALPAYSDAMESYRSTTAPPPAPTAPTPDDEDLPLDVIYLAASELDEDEEPSIEERIANLEEEIEHHTVINEMWLPAMLMNFSDRGIDPDEGELARLEELLDVVLETERQHIEEKNVKIDAKRARMAAAKASEKPPLAERIHDPAARARYVDKLATHLVSLDREARRASTRRYSAQRIAELKQTLPHFKAESLAQDLEDEVLTEVWRRERGRAVNDMSAMDAFPYSASSSLRGVRARG